MRKALCSLCLFVFLAASVSTAQAQVKLQLGFLVDGSGSIASSDFQIIVNALATALADPNLVPQDGTVEVCIVQFADVSASTEVPPTVITSSTIGAITQQIRNISQRGGGTPLWLGLDQIVANISSSANFATAQRQTINIATDGEPRVPIQSIDVAQGTTLSLAARDRAINIGVDEIDAEGVGQATTGSSFQNFLLNVVWPQPGVLVNNGSLNSNFQPGFVILVTQFQDFAQAVRDKVNAIVGSAGLGGNNEPGGTAAGPNGRPIPFDTPLGTVVLSLFLGLMLVLVRLRGSVSLMKK